MADVTRLLETKKAVVDILGELFEKLDHIKKDASQDYKIVGKSDEQATDWRTHELLWEDDDCTIPKYRDIWEYVDIPEDEMTTDRLAKLDAVDAIYKALEKLI